MSTYETKPILIEHFDVNQGVDLKMENCFGVVFAIQTDPSSRHRRAQNTRHPCTQLLQTMGTRINTFSLVTKSANFTKFRYEKLYLLQLNRLITIHIILLI
jgi:hypothetical protein